MRGHVNVMHTDPLLLSLRRAGNDVDHAVAMEPALMERPGVKALVRNVRPEIALDVRRRHETATAVLAAGGLDEKSIRACERPTHVRLFVSRVVSSSVRIRATFVQQVVPVLRSIAGQNGLDLTIVDNDFEGREELVMADEVAKALSTSVGPAFLLIAGPAYGDRPFPATIPKDEFDAIYKQCKRVGTPDALLSLLKTYFRLDDNVLPDPAYVQVLMDNHPDVTSMLRSGSKRLAADVHRKYVESVTDEETDLGILANRNADKQAFCVLREWNEEGMDNETLGRLNDMRGNATRALPKENIVHVPNASEESDEVVAVECEQMAMMLGQAILSDVPRKLTQPPLSELDQVLVENAQLCLALTDQFVTSSLKEVVDKALATKMGGMAIIHGPPGSGKTGILASAVKALASEADGKRARTVYRLSKPYDLKAVAVQVAGKSDATWPACLGSPADSSVPLTVVLNDVNPRELTAAVKALAPSVRILATVAAPDVASSPAPIAGAERIPIPELGDFEIEAMLKDKLRRLERTVNAQQMRILVARVAKVARTPLMVHVSAVAASQWRSWENPADDGEFNAVMSVRDMVNLVFSRLTAKHGGIVGVRLRAELQPFLYKKHWLHEVYSKVFKGADEQLVRDC